MIAAGSAKASLVAWSAAPDFCAAPACRRVHGAADSISVIAFIVGLRVDGIELGRAGCAPVFFPFFLLFLCVPLSAVADTITVPCGLFATTSTSFICHIVLGYRRHSGGNRLLNANGTYQYEVVAACRGSQLTAIFALTTIYGFTAFRSSWRTFGGVGFELSIGGWG